MSAVMELIISAKDEASKVLNDVSAQGSKAAGMLEQSWLKIGIASAAAGVAVEGMARGQATLSEQTRKLAASTDMTEEEVRDLAGEMTNVTFPMKDVLGLMEQGRQQGLKTGAELKNYANFWDMVGDATGEASVLLAESAISLRAVGIDASNSEEALSAFGFISRETTLDLAEFNKLVGRISPEMIEMGMSINDVAALLGSLQENGMDARVAQMELKQAMTASNGDMNVLLKTLGITTTQFDEYTNKVEESSDVIQTNAAIHADSFTAMEKLGAKASELQYKYGDLLASVSALTPVMLGLGPAIKLYSVLAGMATAQTGLFSAALWANPLVWIAVAIAAVVAALFILEKKFGAVTKVINIFKGAWNGIKEKLLGVETATDDVGDAQEDLEDKLKASGDELDDLRDSYEKLESAMNKVKQLTEDYDDTMRSLEEAELDLAEQEDELAYQRAVAAEGEDSAAAKAIKSDIERKKQLRDLEKLELRVAGSRDRVNDITAEGIAITEELEKANSEVAGLEQESGVKSLEELKKVIDAKEAEHTGYAKQLEEIEKGTMAMWDTVPGFFSEMLTRVVGFFRDNWALIMAILFPAVGIPLLIMQNWEPIAEFFTDLWERVKGIFSSAWGGITEIVKGAINSILSTVNGMIAAIELAFNSVIGILNAFELRFPGLKIKGVQIIPAFTYSLPKIPAVSLPSIPLMDSGGIIEGPGLFAVGRGVTEIARAPNQATITITNLNIHANTEVEGRSAARAFIDEVHRRGLRLSGV